jgi:hypothetical protein
LGKKKKSGKRGVDLISDALPFGGLWQRAYRIVPEPFLIAGWQMIRPVGFRFLNPE